MSKRQDAQSLLVHYFRLAMEAAGLNWTSDNQVEVAEIVDLIIDAAVEEAARRYPLRDISPVIGVSRDD